MGGSDRVGRFSLRPAAATIEDGLLFARLLDEAQEGMYRKVLGRRAADIVAQAFTQPGNDLSYQHAIFADQSGRIVGMASGYTAQAHRHFTDQILEAAAGWRRYRWAAFVRVARRMFRFIDTVPDGDFYVRALAVEPSDRGAGIGTLLLGSLEDTAQAAGSKRFALDVAAKNRNARRLYERLGMTAEAESPRWFRLPNTNLIRMVKAL
jgi:ribosomal protein S18 acetylase RimI-like enzyme